ncbi:arginase [Fluviibacterium sp. DFM31]|uniref:Arginase n=1 Tax=Meridianimarinicoccus marinus TaxID=3231483 RepID=A0ABV3L924_9RHOB
MTRKTCCLIGAPVDEGAVQRGCVMGPDAYRTAGLAEQLRDLGHLVEDRGNLSAAPRPASHPNAALKNLPEIAGWVPVLEQAAYEAAACDMPIFLGGNHALSAGTVPGVARRSAERGQPQFVLWLDAHPDLHTLASTRSGNLHGTPLRYLIGDPGFEDVFPPITAPVPEAHVCFMGLRSVDPAEQARLHGSGMAVHDMRALDERGVSAPLLAFLDRVKQAGGALHVSLDVDFLDPAIAPAVGTTVPGGATFREAHLIMELLHESGLVTSLDLVELNPFLDDRGRTALLMVDLCASLLGRKVLDRQTRSAA